MKLFQNLRLAVFFMIWIGCLFQKMKNPSPEKIPGRGFNILKINALRKFENFSNLQTALYSNKIFVLVTPSLNWIFAT